MLAPSVVAARAAANGVELWSLTDHDVVLGLAEARAEAADHRMPYVDGIEISITWRAQTIHIVGLAIDPNNESLVQGVTAARSDRQNRAAKIADQLAVAGVKDALVDLSGNMVAIGNALAHDGWVVGVRDPEGNRASIGRIRLHDEAVSTSGNYEQFVDVDGKRYGHIIDPRTGWSAQGLSSVTVVTKSGMTSDAWDTGLVVLGSARAREIARRRDDIAVVIVEPQPGGPNIVWVEEQLRSRFEIEPGIAKTYTVRYF